MRKLISISLIIALLVTFVVPAAVGAEVKAPEAATVPGKPTDISSLGGALVWTILGVQYIMGRAVGDTTEHLAGTVGYWSDELAVPIFGSVAAIMDGVGGLLGGLGGLLGMEGIFDPLGDMLAGLADVLADFLP